ncbi:uncharacterized protein EI90DRAFT_3285838 [Cantharellus anzutake]|uniref:uncharacterized protein n=1 Tax=Cantharellus anzutake TaxID=1750568 RepID=UPI001906FCF7|nr:uncharacterized protein EI90DRAFT_3285838 [Cantharellus anzutake]KAF8340441.1 hypothetical protein EI90DRAFT_3285838 [Cantharellus anzutake]
MAALMSVTSIRATPRLVTGNRSSSPWSKGMIILHTASALAPQQWVAKRFGGQTLQDRIRGLGFLIMITAAVCTSPAAPRPAEPGSMIVWLKAFKSSLVQGIGSTLACVSTA